MTIDPRLGAGNPEAVKYSLGGADVETPEHPHERMRRLREAKRLSLQDLSDAVGLSKAHVWELERSTIRMEHASYHNLCNLAAALGVSLSVLMRSR